MRVASRIDIVDQHPTPQLLMLIMRMILLVLLITGTYTRRRLRGCAGQVRSAASDTNDNNTLLLVMNKLISYHESMAVPRVNPTPTDNTIANASHAKHTNDTTSTDHRWYLYATSVTRVR